MNILRPQQNGREFAEEIIEWIFYNENYCDFMIKDHGAPIDVKSSPNRLQAITWTNDDPVRWRKPAAYARVIPNGLISYLKEINKTISCNNRYQILFNYM